MGSKEGGKEGWIENDCCRAAQLIGLIRSGGRTDGRREAKCMNNDTRGMSVDFPLLPQLIKDATQ